MCSYTIMATIVKINGSALYFKGVGENFKKVNDFSRNILTSRDGLKEVKLEESYFELKDTGNLTSDAFYRELFLQSMLHKRPLLLTIEENGNEKYSIIAIEVP